MADKVLYTRSKGFFPSFERRPGPIKTNMHYCPGCGHGILHKLIAEAIEDFGIKDKPLLRRVDKRISSYRTAELLAKPLSMPFNFDHLVAIHSHLFGDIYPSAGMIRTSSSKKHREYCQPEYITSSAERLFDNLRQSKYLMGISDVDDFVNELAYYMGEVEALHPFLDGNGRSTRLFFDTIAHKAGYVIGWGSSDPDHFLEANVAALEGDYQALIDVLEEIVIPVAEEE